MPPSPPPLDEHGFPIPPSFDGPPAARGPSRTFQLIWRSALVLAFIAVLLGMLFRSTVAKGAREWVAGQLAQRALEKERRGDLEGALVDANRAASWVPDNPQILELRARIKLTLNDVQGSLEDYTALLKIDRRYAPAYLRRSVALQRLNRHREAIDDLTQAIRLSDSRDATPRNNRAYARALAGIDLKEALDDVNQAIDIVDEDISRAARFLGKPSPLGVPDLSGQKAAYLDTRGYIYYLQERYNDALADLEQAIQLSSEYRDAALLRLPAPYRAFFDRRFEQELAVMYHHRGQVYEKLGKQQESRADLDLATQLGYNPDEGVF